jgi:uncharacterized protein YndB with AHSA1/START domain
MTNHTNHTPSAQATVIERTYPASREAIWDLWTTADGIGRWWAPDGFRTDVTAIDVRPGGSLVYEMTAVAPETIAFMEGAGMPLVTESRKTFTEVDRPRRLGYRSLIDFVPGQAPYEHLTLVELESVGDETTTVRMTMDPLHDAEWTERLVAGRTNELANLGRLLGAG